MGEDPNDYGRGDNDRYLRFSFPSSLCGGQDDAHRRNCFSEDKCTVSCGSCASGTSGSDSGLRNEEEIYGAIERNDKNSSME